LYGVTVSDTLPSQVVFGSEAHGGGWTSVGSAAIPAWSFVNPFLPGMEFTFTVTGTTSCAGGTATNSGWVAGGAACGPVGLASAADSFTLIAPVPAVGLSLAHAPATPAAGGAVSYKLVVTNGG